MDSENIVPPAEPSAPAESTNYQPPNNGAAAQSAPGSAPSGGKQFRGKRRRFRHANGKNRQRQNAGGHQQKQPNHQQQQNQQNRGNGQGNNAGVVFTAPMDHSYRQSNGDVNGNTTASVPGRGQKRFGRNTRQNGRQHGRNNGRMNPFNQNNVGRAGMPPAALGSPQIEPVPQHDDNTTRIFGFVEDLFFVTKMNETARKLNVRLEFVKTLDELLEKTGQGEEKPSLIIVDLNNANLRPLTVIPKLRAQFKKGTSILGFVPHVQGDLKVKAQEAGCDTVMPRSAFSANLPQLLRRHGGPEEIE